MISKSFILSTILVPIIYFVNISDAKSYAGDVKGRPDAAASGDQTALVDAPKNADDRRSVTGLVTGSNIRITNGAANKPTNAFPLQVYDRAALDRSGFGVASDFLAVLPINSVGLGPDFEFAVSKRRTGVDNGFMFPSVRTTVSGYYFFRSGNQKNRRSPNLRFLGNDATLLLVNGRRQATNDVSLLPFSAIDRIEILKDGASAIYGANAVAGVVNVILKDRQDGTESSVRYGTETRENGGSQFIGSASKGGDVGNGRYFAAYEYAHHSNNWTPDYFLGQPYGNNRHSGYGKISQNITPYAEVFVEGRVNTARFLGSAGYCYAPDYSVCDTRIPRDAEYSGTIGASFDISDSLRVETGAHFNRNAVEQTFGDWSYTNTIWAYDTKASGALFDLPGGTSRFAIGAEYRREKRYLSRFLADNFRLDRKRLRETAAVFGELFVPLISDANSRPGLRRLEISAAGRFDRHSDIDNATSSKASLLWSPIGGLTFNGSYSQSFFDPYSEFRWGGPEYVRIATVDDQPVVSINGGSTPNMRTETSKNFTLSAALAPAVLPGFNLSVGYFNIRLDNRLALDPLVFGDDLSREEFDLFPQTHWLTPRPDLIAAAQDVIARVPDPYPYPMAPFPSCIEGVYPGQPYIPAEIYVPIDDRSGCVALDDAVANGFGFVDVRPANRARSKIDGLDINASYSFDTDYGQFNLAADINYLLSYDNAVSRAAPYVSDLNVLGGPAGLRMRNSVGWQKGGIAATVFVNHVNSYSGRTAVRVHKGDIDVGSFTTIDLSTSFDLEALFRSSIFDDAVVTLAASNLADQDRPIVFADGVATTNFDSLNANRYGRNISFKLSKGF